MLIRIAVPKDIEMLTRYDHHVARQELENIIRLKRVYIAEEQGEFVGWLRYSLFWDSIPFMNMLYLLEDSRGRGCGKQLVRFWEEQMKKSNYETVMTSTQSNEYAQHFYDRLGYLAIGGFRLNNDPFELILSKSI